MSSSDQQISDTDQRAIAALTALPSILELVCRQSGMRFAAVAHVTCDRWVACAVRDEIAFGLKPGDELPIETTICREIEQSQRAVVIDHVDADAVYSNHHTPKLYGFQSYISIPILRRSGQFFGTLCALDPAPRQVSDAVTVHMFEAYARLIGAELESEDALADAQRQLEAERSTGKLREEFIAVIGHDLRNPLQAVFASAEVLAASPNLSERVNGLIRNIGSSAQRMRGLIDNLLDFARGRLGGGIALALQQETQLQQHLEQVVAELRAVHRDHRIETDLQIDQPVYCDPARVAQIFSNLLANALLHGDVGQPVSVKAQLAGERFELSVANSGRPIPEEQMAQLFQPFVRASERKDAAGLGLGLYIASQLASAHHGELTAQSDADRTTFVLSFPHGAPA